MASTEGSPAVRFYVLVAITETAIIAGSGIDACWRPVAQRRLWLIRWFWWHVAPLWLAWLAFVAVLMRSAEAVAGRSAHAYAARHHNATPLVVADEELSTASGPGPWQA